MYCCCVITKAKSEVDCELDTSLFYHSPLLSLHSTSAPWLVYHYYCIWPCTVWIEGFIDHDVCFHVDLCALNASVLGQI